MAYRGPLPPKRSLGIFAGLQEKFARDDAQKLADQQRQQSLEDRVFGNLRQASRDVQDEERNQKEMEWLDARIAESKMPKPAPKATPERLVTVMKDGKRVLLPQSQAAGMEAPSPVVQQPEDKTLVPVQQEDGTTVYMPRAQAAGKKVPGPGNSGAATITKAVATNKTQLSVIDDAIRELDAHPDAVGLTRGLPLIGDRLDPRLDPKGVGTRAQIANIGSLKIHDRSGAAVSVHEFPRLAPFIPLMSDPPDAIRTKLKKLREAIEMETSALSQGSGPSATKPSAGSGDPEFDALMAKYSKRPPV